MEPIKKAEHVLEYLARYTHRVAISNSRLVALEDGKVTFRYKNRKNNTQETTTIEAVEFMRRFLLHTLPRGFVRIGHYGFLANRNRKINTENNCSNTPIRYQASKFLCFKVSSAFVRISASVLRTSACKGAGSWVFKISRAFSVAICPQSFLPFSVQPARLSRLHN